jgi:hypothetical protein
MNSEISRTLEGVRTHSLSVRTLVRPDVSLGRPDGQVVEFFVSFPTILEQKIMIKILRRV